MRRIMIVDDHPIVRDGLAQLISQKSGNKFEIVGMAGSVTEALSLLKTLSPDMVIVDISLGGTDGTELINPMTTTLKGGFVVSWCHNVFRMNITLAEDLIQ